MYHCVNGTKHHQNEFKLKSTAKLKNINKEHSIRKIGNFVEEENLKKFDREKI